MWFFGDDDDGDEDDEDDIDGGDEDDEDNDGDHGDCNSDSDPQVVVRVLGANLFSPVFSQRFYLAEVPENAPPGSKVIQVSFLFLT